MRINIKAMFTRENNF